LPRFRLVLYINCGNSRMRVVRKIMGYMVIL